MIRVPKLIRSAKPIANLRKYMETEFTEVMHTTLNPRGPGAVRIHLIPPKEEEDIFSPSVAIINGTDIVPVNFLWAIMLCELIKHINVYDGKEIGEEEMSDILGKTSESIKKLCWFLGRKKIRNDLSVIFETLRQIAYRKEVTAPIKHLSIGEYADFMKAPHRMDIMVSSMTRDGKWHCNQRCVHCYAAGQPHAGEEELSTEDWKKILDSCRAAGIPQVTFTGGEPTMRDDLFELIEYSRWFISRLNTNGIKLTAEYCERLKDADLDSVQITFYSQDPGIHNTLVGAQQFENTAAGIDNAIKAGLSVSINTPLCTLNKDYVKTLEYLHEHGVIYVTCSGLITTGNAAKEASEDLQLTEEEIKDILRDAVKYCGENGMEIAFTSPGWVENEYFDELKIPAPACGACLSNMAITPSGNIVPCQSWLSEEALGNMLHDDWETVWNSLVCTEYRNNSAQMSGKCPLRRYCKS